jgi:hypothetical protein
MIRGTGISQMKWQWFSQASRKLIDMEAFDSASRDPWSSFMFLFRCDLTVFNNLRYPSEWVRMGLKFLFSWNKT